MPDVLLLPQVNLLQSSAHRTTVQKRAFNVIIAIYKQIYGKSFVLQLFVLLNYSYRLSAYFHFQFFCRPSSRSQLQFGVSVGYSKQNTGPTQRITEHLKQSH